MKKINGIEITVDLDKAKKVAILVNVQGHTNNNKYYYMFDMGNELVCEAGRVGYNPKVYKYDPSEWSRIYKKKTDGSRGKAGTYTDVTATSLSTSASPISVSSSSNKKMIVDINSSLPTKIQLIMNDLMGYSKSSIKTNYSVDVDAVNELQVIKAQEMIDELSHSLKMGISTEQVNDGLIKLYQIIPRKMNKVQNYLLSSEEYKINHSLLNQAEKMLANEQATLDVMSQQVSQYKQAQQQATKQKTSPTKKDKTILDMLGITMREIDNEEIKLIKNLLGRNSNQFRKAFKVDNIKTLPKFQNFVDKRKNKETKLFWHGSRNENWMSILETGLVLRPANAVITGKMVGYGIYFSDVAQKSIGYTSLKGSYWASGNDRKAYLALFKVHIGNYLHTKRHESWMYDLNWDNLQKRGNYDSVFFEGGVDLKNNEYVVYKEYQTTVEYIIEISS